MPLYGHVNRRDLADYFVIVGVPACIRANLSRPALPMHAQHRNEAEAAADFKLVAVRELVCTLPALIWSDR